MKEIKRETGQPKIIDNNPNKVTTVSTEDVLKMLKPASPVPNHLEAGEGESVLVPRTKGSKAIQS